jgi:hypothetical protein
MIKRTIIGLLVAILALGALAGCKSAAETADENLTKKAENFEVPRRIVGINAITGDALFEVTGYCSYKVTDDTVEALCATNKNDRKGSVERTTLGRADNVTFVSTQLGGVEVDFFSPTVVFRPEQVIPNFDLQSSADN